MSACCRRKREGQEMRPRGAALIITARLSWEERQTQHGRIGWGNTASWPRRMGHEGTCGLPAEREVGKVLNAANESADGVDSPTVTLPGLRDGPCSHAVTCSHAARLRDGRLRSEARMGWKWIRSKVVDGERRSGGGCQCLPQGPQCGPADVPAGDHRR